MQIEGIGKHTARNLSEQTDHNCSVLFEKSRDELIESLGLTTELAQKIVDFDGWDHTDYILDRTTQLNCTMIGLGDKEYPHRLYHIYDPPPLLWVHGNTEALAMNGLALVGTRNPSTYGREMAQYWVEQLSGLGLTFISGFARGIDTIVHKTAIRHREITIAVLGSGIDRVYPSENRSMIRRLIDLGGAIVTEYPPESDPLSHHFPERNRIVSGLSAGVIIIESGLKGGSMITARCANDEGRELFVIPHALTFEKGQGGNSILKRGEGKLIQTRQDLFDELPWLASDVGVASTGVAGIAGSAGSGDAGAGTAVAGASTGVAGIAGSAALVGAGDSAHSLRRRWEEYTMDEISRMICQCLSEVSEPMTLDHLSEVTGYSVHDVMIRLISLEMDQLIEQRPGNRIKLR